MTVLIIGYLNDIAITYLNAYARDERNQFICVDYKEENEYSDVYFANCTIINDVINKDSIEDIINMNSIDCVINFYEIKDSKNNLEQFNKHNYEFVIELYDLCKEYNIYLIHSSTIYVYGNSNINFCNEESNLRSTSHYITSKINADTFLSDKEVCVLRFGDTFGCLYSDNYMNKIIKSLINDKQIIIEEDNEFYRSYICVVDCSYIINEILNNKIFGIYNVNSNFYLPAKELLNIILSYCNTKYKVLYSSTKEVDILVLKSDSSLISDKLNYKFKRQEEKFKFFLDKCLDI